MHGGEVHLAGQSADDVGGDDAEEDGDYLYHALAPNVADYYDRDGKQRYEPVGIAVMMAEDERVRPMQIMMGPTTMGGKKRITFFMPKH